MNTKEIIAFLKEDIKRLEEAVNEESEIGWQNTQVNNMKETELKHVIAMLLEDAKHLQQIEPNAGTEARIWLANKTLNSLKELSGLCSGISTERQLS